MAKNIEVTLTLDTKNFNRNISSAQGSLKGFTASSGIARGSIIGLAARLAPLAAGFIAVKSAFDGLGKSLGTAAQFQDVQVTLTNIIGSAEGGAAALEMITRAAEELPFAFEELSSAAPALSTVSKNIGDLEDNMMLAADIAATFGIPFQDAASQLQRAFSAGAGAADVFREKGVLAAAGFQAGVSYSVDETIAKLREMGEELQGAANTLNTTFTGASSQAGDALTIFRKSIGDAILPEATAFLNELVQTFRDNKTEVLAFGNAIGTNVVEGVIAFARAIAVGIDILLSMGRTVTQIGQYIRQNFGEQIRVVANFVVRAFAGIVEAVSLVGKGVGKLIELTTGSTAVSDFFDNVNEAANKVRREGLDAIEDVSQGLGNFIPVRTARDAVDNFVTNFREGAQEIRDAAVDMSDRTEDEINRIPIALANASDAISQGLNILDSVISQLQLYKGEPIIIPVEFTPPEDSDLTGIIDYIPFEDIAQFKKDIEELGEELGMVTSVDASATAYGLLQQAIAGAFISTQDYGKMLEIIDDLHEQEAIDLRQKIDLLNELDKAYEDQEGLRSFLNTIGQAQVALSQDLATALLEGKNAADAFKDFFKKLVTQLIADALRLAIIQPILSSLFGFQFGVGGSVTGLDFGGSFFGKIFGKAAGGPVMGNKPYIVGERGAELFIPNTSGEIIPNNRLGGGTTVNYNIQAVDASSFRTLVARDPEFIFAVTEAGRRRLPR